MTADVQTKAGLSSQPDKFYTNDSKNMSARLRHKTKGKEVGETAFAKAMKEMIEDDQETYSNPIWSLLEIQTPSAI